VRLRTAGYAGITGILACSVAMFVMKRAVFWPFAVVTPLAAAYHYPRFFTMHNKKLFDMCNVGEEYYLGAQRNFVLRKCNEILDREDF
jgi:hypothetical protein